jgi:CheY-like chemotaxis protein
MMPDRQRILWIDNDKAYLRAFVDRLEESCDVVVAGTVTEAESALRETASGTGDIRPFDLVIIDVMMPTDGEQEEVEYPPAETDDGLHTGLLFYKRMSKVLARAAVMVLTVRIDKGIRKAFIDNGLPQASFVTKMEVQKWPDFIRKVRTLLSQRDGQRGSLGRAR